MTIDEIVEIGDEHFRDMEASGWIDRAKSDNHYLMLVIGEVCEAIQAHRKGCVYYNFHEIPSKWVKEILDDPNSNDLLFIEEFNRFCKDTTADEMADTFLRLLSLFFMHGFSFSYKRPTLSFNDLESFTETSFRFVRCLFSQYYFDNRDGLETAIIFIDEWCKHLSIDLKRACIRKMRYNRMRSDWRNKVKMY